MRWAFSKSEERIATLKWAWENRRVDEEERLWNEGLARPGSGSGGADSSEGGYGYKGMGMGGVAGDGIMRTGSDGIMHGGADGMAMRSNSDPMMRNPSGNGHSRPPRLNLIDPQPIVDAGPLTSLSNDGSWHTPSSSSELHGSHHGSPISDPALMPAQDKTAGSGLAMSYYDQIAFDMNTFNAPDAGAGHFPTESTQYFGAGLGHHAHAGHTMPAHSMAVPHGMSAPIGMAGHGMQASSAPGSTTLPSFNAPHYDAYYSNSSHR
jgi:hypothetical protein